MPLNTSDIGAYGEKLAALYLKKHGYRIITTNIKMSYYELDIVAFKKGVYVFVEVKTQTNPALSSAELALSNKQLTRLKKAIQLYCYHRRIKLDTTRLDCVSINLNNQKGRAKIKHYRDILY